MPRKATTTWVVPWGMKCSYAASAEPPRDHCNTCGSVTYEGELNVVACTEASGANHPMASKSAWLSMRPSPKRLTVPHSESTLHPSLLSALPQIESRQK